VRPAWIASLLELSASSTCQRQNPGGDLSVFSLRTEHMKRRVSATESLSFV
jgi:hypothetical protein